MSNTKTTLASMSPQERVDYALGVAIVAQATNEARMRQMDDRRGK